MTTSPAAPIPAIEEHDMTEQGNSAPHISSRKDDHIDLCATDQVEYRRKSTMLEEVELLHDSLPEIAMDEISLAREVMGRKLDAPLLITGMTGGAERAREINRELARVAQHLGLAFGVGSQRAMFKHPDLTETYQVRDIAPDILLFGNIGVVQAAEMSTQQAQDLVGSIGADALCVHLNPGQELIQPEGDRDFKGCLDGLARLVEELDVPIIAKETGCGLSHRTLDKLARVGVEWVDVSGAGGTTWIGVETLRTPPSERSLGELLWEWGTPTAASIVWAKRRGMNVIGSGGLRNGMDAARAYALGADIAGMALPWLKAVYDHGADHAIAYGENLIHALRTILCLTGSASPEALADAPRIIHPRLATWLDQDPLVRQRRG